MKHIDGYALSNATAEKVTCTARPSTNASNEQNDEQNEQSTSTAPAIELMLSSADGRQTYHIAIDMKSARVLQAQLGAILSN
jgi:hypothetical protein